MRRMLVRALVCAIFFSLVAWIMEPVVAEADPPLIYPGMLIRQGTLSCTLGYVDTQMRIGITAGHCFSGDGTVRNSDDVTVGHKIVVNDNQPPEGPLYDKQYATDYEVISFDNNLPLNDILPDGRRLERDDSVAPTIDMPICRTGVTTGDACGSIIRVGNGWFRFGGPTVNKGDSGGPVYTTIGDRTVLVGIIRGIMTSPEDGQVRSWATSWPSVIKQIQEDWKQLPPN